MLDASWLCPESNVAKTEHSTAVSEVALAPVGDLHQFIIEKAVWNKAESRPPAGLEGKSRM